MVVGQHNREGDMNFNICKERKITNMRQSTSEIVERLEPSIKFTLEEAIDFVASDELVEVTPKGIRVRKRTLNADARYREARDRARAS